MNQSYSYIFILGRYPELSRQEILSVLKKSNDTFSETVNSKSVLVIKTNHELDIPRLNSTLGGTVKIGIVEYTMDLPYSKASLQDYFTSAALFINYFQATQTKITFGMSYYSALPEKTDTLFSSRLISELVHEIKTHLELQSFKVRFPKHDGLSLSSASVAKNKLITDGCEILLIETSSELLIGRTLAVQEFEAFSKRDYGRPNRDMDSGIMPPKLARMMINVAEVSHEDPIIDPFCGSGTMLQEALLLGYTDVTGSDNSKKALSDTKKNIEWLTKQSDLHITPTLANRDVTKLSDYFAPDSFAAIITEPFMGPNSQISPQLSELQKNRDELQVLYRSAFEEFVKVLRPGGSIVMILPIFHLHNNYLFMDVLTDGEKIGLVQIPLSEATRHTVTVGNSYDNVLREVVKWKKVTV